MRRCGTWRVWIGLCTAPAVVVAPLGTDLAEIGRMGKLGLLEEHQAAARPEFEESDRQRAEDAIAGAEVTRLERGEDVWLDPRAGAVE